MERIHRVSFALKSFSHLLSGYDVKWSTDNQAVPSTVHSGSMKEHLHAGLGARQISDRQRQ